MKLIVIIFLTLMSLVVHAKSLKVALITPRGPNDLFWGPISRYTKIAAKSFGMEVEVFYAASDHHEMIDIAKMVMNKKYDALITTNFKKQGERILKLSEKYQVPTVLITGGLSKGNTAGRPREKYKYWIGEILPDDITAGALLLNILNDVAKSNGKERTNLLAVEGNIADSGSYDRVAGLMKSIKTYRKINFLQIVSANWSPQLAKTKFKRLHKARYPRIDIVWSASDGMALGVIEGAKELGKTPGKDIYIGGVDWSKEGLQAVKRGDMVTSLGGHVFHGAWAVVLISDYLNGVPQAKLGQSIRTKMEPIMKDKADQYLKIIQNSKLTKFNYKKFSKANHPDADNEYQFSVSKLLK